MAYFKIMGLHKKSHQMGEMNPLPTKRNHFASKDIAKKSADDASGWNVPWYPGGAKDVGDLSEFELYIQEFFQPDSDHFAKSIRDALK